MYILEERVVKDTDSDLDREEYLRVSDDREDHYT